MAEQRKEIDAIANNPAAPTFENTIVALERSGQLLTRVATVFFNLIAPNTNDSCRRSRPRCRRSCRRTATRSASTPRCSRASDALRADARRSASMPESLRLLERYHTDFVRAGASCPTPTRRKLKAAERASSTLTDTQFSQNVLKATNDARGRRRRRERARRPHGRADRRRRRGGEGARARRQVRASRCRTPPASRRSTQLHEPRAARAHLSRLDDARQQRRRVRQHARSSRRS